MEINQNNNLTEYFTHANGARPYKVTINNNHVNVYKSTNEDDENYNCLVLDITPQQIFIGKSIKNKMTEFSGGYGDEFDGNSILLKVNDTTSIYVGEKIMLFHTLNPIVSYHSPVGNNDVPYPWAVDSENNHYLIIEEVIVKSSPVLEQYFANEKEPYSYYYDANLITEDLGCNRKPLFANEFNITKFYIGKESYTLRYCPDPSKDYDRVTSDLGAHIYVRDKANNKYEVTKQKYIEIMGNFGNQIGVIPMLNSLVLDTFH